MSLVKNVRITNRIGFCAIEKLTCQHPPGESALSHPIIYALGETENANFPLILTIGREPNYDDKLINFVGKIDIEEFRSMSGGVWVTAYTQIAKQYFGSQGSSRQLKSICFKKNGSPILFSNAFPVAIPNEIGAKLELRASMISQIPKHVETLFSNKLLSRVRLVIQHGADTSEPSLSAQEHITSHCRRLGIHYVSSPFFYNGNSLDIQQALLPAKQDIVDVMDEFMCRE